MITGQYSHYLPFLAAGNNLLVLSNDMHEMFASIKDHFHTYIHHSLSSAHYQEIDATLLHHNINIVVIDAVDQGRLARDFFDAIQQYNKRIVIIVVTSLNADKEELKLIRDANASLFKPFTQQELNSRLFSSLGIFYVIKSIGRREINLKNQAKVLAEDDYFLDQYQGSILFIVDELTELNMALMHGELSYELLKKIAEKLTEISGIFALTLDLTAVSDIIKEIITFIESIKLESLDPSQLKSFDYLANMIDDVNRNMMDMFVDRVVKDVNKFVYSLQSNLEYIKSTFAANVTPSTPEEVEFF